MSSPMFSSKYYLFWVHQNKDFMMLMELFYKTITHAWNISSCRVMPGNHGSRVENSKDRDNWQLMGLCFSSTNYKEKFFH